MITLESILHKISKTSLFTIGRLETFDHAMMKTNITYAPKFLIRLHNNHTYIDVLIIPSYSTYICSVYLIDSSNSKCDLENFHGSESMNIIIALEDKLGISIMSEI